MLFLHFKYTTVFSVGYFLYFKYTFKWTLSRFEVNSYDDYV